MIYPCTWINNETKKEFTVTKNPANNYNGGGETIRCVEAANVQRGHCGFHVRGKSMDLHIIQSHPEKGTGLGSLLIYFLSIETLRNGCEIINVLSAAANARQFYSLMGFEPDPGILEEYAMVTEPTRRLEVWPGIFLAPSPTPSTEVYAKVVGSAPMIGSPPTVMQKSFASVVKRWEPKRSVTFPVK